MTGATLGLQDKNFDWTRVGYMCCADYERAITRLTGSTSEMAVSFARERPADLPVSPSTLVVTKISGQGHWTTSRCYVLISKNIAFLLQIFLAIDLAARVTLIERVQTS